MSIDYNLVDVPKNFKNTKKLDLIFSNSFFVPNKKYFLFFTEFLLNELKKQNFALELNFNKYLNNEEIKYIIFEILKKQSFASYKNLEIDSFLVDEIFSHLLNFKENNIDLINFFNLKFTSESIKQDLFKIYSEYELFKKKKKLFDRFDLFSLFLDLKFKKKLNLKNIKKDLDYYHINIENISNREKEILFLLGYDFNSNLDIYKKKDLNFSKKEKKENEIININITHCDNLDQIERECLFYLNNFFETKKETFICIQREDLVQRFLKIAKENNILVNTKINFGSSYYTNLILDIIKIIIDPKNSTIELVSLLEYLKINKKTISYLLRKKDLSEKNLFFILTSQTKFDIDPKEDIFLNQIRDNLKNLVSLHHSKTSLKKIILKLIEDFNFLSPNKNFYDQEEVRFFLNLINVYLKVDSRENLEYFYSFSKNCIDLKFYFSTSNSCITIGDSFNYKNQSNILFPYSNEFTFFKTFKRDKFETSFSITKEIFEKYQIDSLNKLLNKENIIFVLFENKQKLHSYFGNYNLVQTPLNSNNLEIFSSNLDKIKYEIINKLNKYLDFNQFELAKRELDLLNHLFSKKKDLTSFFDFKHPQLDYYKNILSNKPFQSFNFEPKNQVYSVSQLKTYQSCPKKYEFQYIYKIPSLPKHYFDFGTSIHSVLEEILPLFSANLSKEEIFSKAMMSLSNNWISLAYIDSNQEKEYKQKGILAIKNFIEKQNMLKLHQKTIFLEKEFHINIDSKKLIGYIDRVDLFENEFKVLDYKTSNSCQSKEYLKQDFQLYVYAKAIKELKGKFPKSMGLWYLNFNKIEEIDFDEKDYKKVIIEIKKIFERIENLDFSPNPSKFNCTYCDFNKLCSHSFDNLK